MQTKLTLKDSKPHYEILDGLRGVAALLVVLFHVLEVHSGGDHAQQMINHGYLAVDFFFILSGFVVGYAYDDRWGKMTLKAFFKRRIIRLQPMIIIGSIIGAILFYYQYSPGLGWAGIADVPLWKMLLVMVIGFTLIPVGKGLDIRGWHEMHPLNGPAWSLFFEYVANILYALVLHKLSKRVLALLVCIAAGFTIQYALTNPNGDIIGGWSIDDALQMKIGFIRLAFPFLMGLLMARIGKLRYTKHAFLVTSLLLVALFSVPRLGGTEQIWLNGLYECFCILIMFPFIVWLGAGGEVKGKKGSLVCKFLGDISYPIYITHFPIAYVYMAWVTNNNMTLAESWPFALLVVVSAILVAYLSMKLYDIPLRKWLRKKYL
ncbi:acyltransferase family protein [Bacteroides coprosuis]|uniref:acyltransferase family protein n=1 Tax=Bacteroides coprosuis TaxID=151276 RepID=UPI001E1678E2|nr:acyltransferase [Bacteroides coprosuis]HJD91288.1 acyltransferase [Bacteroides coprosuis]